MYLITNNFFYISQYIQQHLTSHNFCATNHYEVIISLTDEVFTLGPFRESFMSLLNIDRFCVNLEMHLYFNINNSQPRYKAHSYSIYKKFLMIINKFITTSILQTYSTNELLIIIHLSSSHLSH